MSSYVQDNEHANFDGVRKQMPYEVGYEPPSTGHGRLTANLAFGWLANSKVGVTTGGN